MINNNEIWKRLIHDKIADGYELSSYGRIRILNQANSNPYEPSYHSTNGYDYELFLLKSENNDFKQQLFPIDELLASTFIPIPDELDGKRLTVKHINGDNHNNHISNLEWIEDTEIWKISTYPDMKNNMYSISNHGYVKNNFSNKEIHPFPNHGYAVIGAVKPDGKQKHIFVHRIVAHEFIGIPEKYDVNHIDGNKLNNHWKNLECVSRSKNIHHAIDTRLNPSKGETHPQNKFSENAIICACKLLVKHNGSIQTTLNEMKKYKEYANMNRAVLERIKYKKNWTHISDDYFMENSFDKCIYGESNIGSKLSNSDAEMICQKLLEFNGSIINVVKHCESIGKLYITRATIAHIKYKHNWKWLSDKYFDKDAFK